MSGERLRANRRIEQMLREALDAAKLGRCSVPQEHQDAMRRYLDTWVAGRIEQALHEMHGGRPHKGPHFQTTDRRFA